MDELLATLTKEIVMELGNHEGDEPSIGEDAPQGSGVEVPVSQGLEGKGAHGFQWD